MSKVQLENIGMNPSVQHVVAQYLYYRNVVDQLPDGNTKTFCNEKLERVDALLAKPFRRRITLVWRLLHRVGEELFLVMSQEELAAEGHKLLEGLKISSIPDTLKNHWIEILHGKVTELEKPSTNLDATRQLFKAAANTINECVDDRFWDIAVRKSFAFIYGSLLLITGIFLLCKTWYYDGQFCLSMLNILLIGAIGGLVSGLITTDQEYISKGHFWIPTLYYSLIRPTAGAVAAVVVFWMVESHYLIQVEPPLRNCCVGFACISTNVRSQAAKKGDCADTGDNRKQVVQWDVSLPGVAEAAGPESKRIQSPTSSSKIKKTKIKAKKQPEAGAGTAQAKKDAPFKNNTGAQAKGDGKGDTSLITLRTSEGKQIYLYLLLLFFAGFSGDKILKSVSCKLNAKMFADAEKTKEAKK